MTTKMKTTPKVSRPCRISKRGRKNEGKPRLWTDPEAFVRRSDEYFKNCTNRIKAILDKGGEVAVRVPAMPTISGWSAWMGWHSKDGYREYLNLESHEF